MIVVFFAARSAFRRQMKVHGSLTGRKIFWIAAEVGTLTHFYAFALYLPIVFILNGGGSLSGELFGMYIVCALIAGFASLIMFVWIAIPMYAGIGYIVRMIEGEGRDQQKILNDSLLDDGLLS